MGNANKSWTAYWLTAANHFGTFLPFLTGKESLSFLTVKTVAFINEIPLQYIHMFFNSLSRLQTQIMMPIFKGIHIT